MLIAFPNRMLSWVMSFDVNVIRRLVLDIWKLESDKILLVQTFSINWKMYCRAI